MTVEQPPSVTTQCESSSGVSAASNDVCHTLETTATPYSTTTTVPSSVAISKSERAATPQVPPFEKATEIPLRSDGIHKTFAARAKSTEMCFSPIAPMKESTTEHSEGEIGTGGGEETSIQVSGATGMYAIVIFLQTYHTAFYTGSLSTGASIAATKSLASAGETSVSQQTMGLLYDMSIGHVTIEKLKPDDEPDFPQDGI